MRTDTTAPRTPRAPNGMRTKGRRPSNDRAYQKAMAERPFRVRTLDGTLYMQRGVILGPEETAWGYPWPSLAIQAMEAYYRKDPRAKLEYIDTRTQPKDVVQKNGVAQQQIEQHQQVLDSMFGPGTVQIQAAAGDAINNCTITLRLKVPGTAQKVMKAGFELMQLAEKLGTVESMQASGFPSEVDMTAFVLEM